MSPAFARTKCTAAALLAALALTTTTAHAQSLSAVEQEARGALLEEAQRARAARDHAAALTAARRAHSMQPTPSVRLFIAEEEREERLYARAFVNARLCASEARRDPTLRNREAIAERCDAMAQSLAAHVGRVDLRVASPPPGLRVRVGDEDVPPSVWGVPYVSSPGAVHIEAVAEGYEPFARSIEVRAGETTTVSIELGPARATTNAPPLPRVDPPRERVTVRGPGAGPWALIGAGGAMAITSAVLAGVVAIDVGYCDGQPDASVPLEQRGCSATEAAERQPRVTGAAIGAWALGATGLAAIAAGALWRALAPSSSGARERAVQLAPAPAGVSLVARF